MTSNERHQSRSDRKFKNQNQTDISILLTLPWPSCDLRSPHSLLVRRCVETPQANAELCVENLLVNHPGLLLFSRRTLASSTWGDKMTLNSFFSTRKKEGKNPPGIMFRIEEAVLGWAVLLPAGHRCEVL